MGVWLRAEGECGRGCWLQILDNSLRKKKKEGKQTCSAQEMAD
jgi:hypothetical protein